MPGGCQHPVTGCVVAGTVDMKKVGWEGVRGIEGNPVECESVWRVGLRDGGDVDSGVTMISSSRK